MEDIDKILEDIDIDKTMLKRRKNDIILSDEQVEILEKYHFDYQKYSNLQSLIYDLEYYLNEFPDATDLDLLSSRLSELNYYQNTNK